jgi:ubiquitin-like 1-activating enzyme E1 B
MAGNIIPAIATTNAIIAGLIVMQSLSLLSRLATTKTKPVFLRNNPLRPLGSSVLAGPDEKCAVCRDVYVPIHVDPTCTLGEFMEGVVIGWMAKALEDEEEVEWTVFEGGRLLADPEEKDNYGRTMGDLAIGRGKMLTLIDEDEVYRAIHFCILSP